MANSAGIVTKVSGESYAISGEKTTLLAVGSSFSGADILVTKAGANLEVKFNDDSLVTLGPSSRIEVKEFIFDAEQQVEPSFVVHMFEGVVRSVSGKVVEQNPEAFKLSSPLAIIGIRGTETLHIISPQYEIHSVVTLGAEHTVVINTFDGRSIIVSDSLLGLRLALGDLSPLQLINTSPELLDEYIKRFYFEKLEGGSRSNPQGVFVFADAEFLNSIANVGFIANSVGFLAIEKLDNLVTALGFQNNIAGNLVGGLFSGDSLSGDTLSGSPTDPTLSGQISPSPINPEMLTPPPILPAPNPVPDPLPNPPPNPPPPPNPIVRPNGQLINQVNLTGTLYGDPSPNMTSHCANDTINISGTMQNNNTVLSGDVSGNISGVGVFGGDDLITVNIIQGEFLYGDAAGEINGGAYGGNDTIMITTDFSNSMTFAYGDALDIKNTSVGGNDSINITGMSAGGVYGDAKNMHDSSVGGNDIITITNMSNSTTTVSGDANSMAAGTTAGNDIITINSMSNGVVYGDANSMAAGTTAGNDIITINNMIDGTIYGDADTMAAGVLGGNDSIDIIGATNNITVEGGVGNDSITISGISGNNINIYGGSSATAIAGNDTFVFTGNASGNSTITIKDFGSAIGTNEDKIGFGLGWSYAAHGASGGDWHITATDGSMNLTVVLEGLGSFNLGQLLP